MLQKTKPPERSKAYKRSYGTAHRLYLHERKLLKHKCEPFLGESPVVPIVSFFRVKVVEKRNIDHAHTTKSEHPVELFARYERVNHMLKNGNATNGFLRVIFKRQVVDVSDYVRAVVGNRVKYFVINAARFNLVSDPLFSRLNPFSFFFRNATPAADINERLFLAKKALHPLSEKSLPRLHT